MKNKHIPQRTCLACRQKRDKKDLIRLVRVENGVEVDTSVRKPGRGAYLCYKKDCWEKGLRKSRLEYALRTEISVENRQVLIRYGDNLSRGG